MKRLIAKRPIQYMGHTYDVGEVLPAYDAAMVAAWLAAGSAEWAETAELFAALSPDAQASDVLRAMGVTITDNVGVFVGAEALEGQIRAAVAAVAAVADGQRGCTEGENGESTELTKILTGSLGAAKLERLTKDDLIKLAADLRVDISAAKNNAERANLLTAGQVQATEGDNGGAQ